MKKWSIVLCLVFVIGVIGARTSFAWEEIEASEIIKVFIHGSAAMIEKKDGTVIMVGSGGGAGFIAKREAAEAAIFRDYLSFRWGKVIDGNILSVHDFLRELLDFGWEEKVRELLPAAIATSIDKEDWLRAGFIFNEFKDYLESNERDATYGILEREAEKNMREGRFYYASSIYEDLGNVRKYREAEYEDARLREQKGDWRMAAYGYEKAGSKEKAIEMLELELQRVREFDVKNNVSEDVKIARRVHGINPERDILERIKKLRSE